jgi:hypothetical protein
MDHIAQLLPNPVFHAVQRTLLDSGSTVRKEILLLARSMSVVTTGNLSIQTATGYMALYLASSFAAQTFEERNDIDSQSHIDFREEYDPVFRDPLYAGAIIISCCIAPFHTVDAQKIQLDSIMKEVHVMDGDTLDPGLDFTPFFGEYEGSMYPTMDPNPKMAEHVHSCLVSWRNRIATKTHFPSMSNKLVPRLTRAEMDRFVDIMLNPPEVATQGSLEYLNAKYGIQMTGEVEMSQRWYTNGITPRTYYISGANTFFAARHMKDIWNSLADSLEVTNRRSRVIPSRIHVDMHKDAFFYDLSSFTSNMVTQRRFLDQLALWCRGFPVTIMEIGVGEVTVDLGEMIDEYNRTCNWFPRYHQFRDDWTLNGKVHGIAGFLGVIGNIASCTFLHGATILQLVENLDECGCAGDDAVLVIEEEERVWGCIPLLGSIAWEKTFRLSDGPVVYLKRKTFLSEGKYHSKLVQSRFFQLPSFLWFLRNSIKHTHPYWRESHKSPAELRSLLVSSLGASFNSGARLRSSKAFPAIYQFMESFYHKARLPRSGYIPQYHTASTVGFIPALESFGSSEYVAETLQANYPGWCRLPLREAIIEDEVWARKGLFIRAVGGRETAVLTKMGVLRLVRKPSAIFAGDDGLERIIREYSSSEPTQFIFEVLEDWVDAFGFSGIPGVVATEESFVDAWYVFGNVGVRSLSDQHTAGLWMTTPTFTITRNQICKKTWSELHTWIRLP